MRRIFARMGAGHTSEVLALIGELKRLSKDPQRLGLMDKIAVDIISSGLHPLTMEQGLREWMGLTADAQ